MTDITINQSIAVAPSLYESRTPIHFKSSPGMGKSDMVRSLTERLGGQYGEEFGLVTLHLSQMDAPDVRGFLVPVKKDGQHPTSVFTKPALIQAIEDTGKSRGIIFFDERAQADHLVQKAVAPVVLDYMVGDWKIPDGWWIVSASNRTQDRAGANRELTHLINREVQVEMKFDLDGWQAWAQGHEVHPMVVAFAQSRPDLFVQEVPNDQKPFMTPRSLSRMGQWLHSVVGNNPDGSPSWHVPSVKENPAVAAIMQGFVGEAAATELAGYSSVAQYLPTKDELLNHPETAKLPPAQELGAHYACLQFAVYHSDADTVGQTFKYIQRLKKEMQVSAAKALLDRSGGTLLNDPALGRFIAENKALIVATLS